MLESQEMRKVYCDTMIALAKEDPRIVDVEADLTGAHGMKPFKAAYPDRSFNVGIAEANMTAAAAGMVIVPCPASFDIRPLLIPWLSAIPKAPPKTASGRKASENTAPKNHGILGILNTMRRMTVRI